MNINTIFEDPSKKEIIDKNMTFNINIDSTSGGYNVRIKDLPLETNNKKSMDFKIHIDPTPDGYNINLTDLPSSTELLSKQSDDST